MEGVDGQLFFEPNALVGFCAGTDPIFLEYKKYVGPFHLTPIEAIERYCKIKEMKCKNTKHLTVIAYILPIHRETKRQNFEYSREWPSEKWAHTRLFGEKANVELQRYLLEELKNEFGIFGIAPSTEPKLFKVHRMHAEAYQGVWASTWSHRHACFAAGLGSFGLSDGFINERGKALRCGSFIIAHELPSDSSKRPASPYQYCNRCGDCVKRCPVGAITFENGYDKQKCSIKVTGTIPYIKEHYNINIYACGLCQVNVSCSDGFP